MKYSYETFKDLESEKIMDILWTMVKTEDEFTYSEDDFSDHIGNLTREDLITVLREDTYTLIDPSKVPCRIEELISLMENDQDLAIAGLEFATDFSDLENIIQDVYVYDSVDDFIIEIFLGECPENLLKYIDTSAIWRDNECYYNTTEVGGRTYIFVA